MILDIFLLLVGYSAFFSEEALGQDFWNFLSLFSMWNVHHFVTLGIFYLLWILIYVLWIVSPRLWLTFQFLQQFLPRRKSSSFDFSSKIKSSFLWFSFSLCSVQQTLVSLEVIKIVCIFLKNSKVSTFTLWICPPLIFWGWGKVSDMKCSGGFPLEHKPVSWLHPLCSQGPGYPFFPIPAPHNPLSNLVSKGPYWVLTSRHPREKMGMHLWLAFNHFWHRVHSAGEIFLASSL